MSFYNKIQKAEIELVKLEQARKDLDDQRKKWKDASLELRFSVGPTVLRYCIQQKKWIWGDEGTYNTDTSLEELRTFRDVLLSILPITSLEAEYFQKLKQGRENETDTKKLHE